MAESSAHAILVRYLHDWICKSLLNGDNGYILVDAPASSPAEKPPHIYNYVPDVCVLRGPQNQLIIGEAKTAKDIENRHTMRQLKAFLERCKSTKNSFLVIAVPWDMVRFMRSMLNDLKSQLKADNVEIIVLDKLSTL